MSSIGSMCGLSRRLGGSHCQGSSGKWDLRSQFSPVPLPQGWSSPTGALVVGPNTAGGGGGGGGQDGSTVGLWPSRHRALAAIEASR